MKLSNILKEIRIKSNSVFLFTSPIYPDAQSFVFENPDDIIEIYPGSELDNKLKKINENISEGKKGIALINYETGLLFEKKLTKYLNNNKCLMKFFFYDNENVTRINSDNINYEKFDLNNFEVRNFKLITGKKKFFTDIQKIKSFIKEGDTYQVNYTTKAIFEFSGDSIELFKQLIFQQSSKYSAFINLGDRIIISLSPELFFEVEGNRITTSPMKGTVKRGINNYYDENQKSILSQSEKNKAENLMIVDLLRNDLGKICKFNSIKVDELFKIEKYETLFQKISTISGKLKNEIKFSDIIKNIFPCGSITGAPKIKTMELINKLENIERGIYTGSIGTFLNNKKVFNVAIRTIELDKKSKKGTIGLGSGIVYDSNPELEYDEILLKGKFLTDREKYFELIETLKLNNGKINFLEEHINRLRNAADFFLFKFDEKLIRNKIESITKDYTKGNFKIRLLLTKWGRLKIEISDLKNHSGKVKIIISENKINSQNKFQYFKTTNRNLYNKEFEKYSGKGFFDVIYFNENQNLAEGSISNIFIKKDNFWFTPKLSSGILNGIYRKYLLQSNSNYFEKELKFDDLINADYVKIVNSVIGEIIVNEIFKDNKFIKAYNVE